MPTPMAPFSPTPVESSLPLGPVPRPPVLTPPTPPFGSAPTPPITQIPQPSYANVPTPPIPFIPPPAPPMRASETEQPILAVDNEIPASAPFAPSEVLSLPSEEKLPEPVPFPIISTPLDISKPASTPQPTKMAPVKKFAQDDPVIPAITLESDLKDDEDEPRTPNILRTQVGDDYSEYLEKAEQKGCPPFLLEKMEHIIKRVRTLEAAQTNYAVIDNEHRYLDYLIKLPWTEETTDTIDLDKARDILNKSHYGMQPVKERILDFLAVQQLAPEGSAAPVLLFLGTPGLGKTTISRAIASALGRKFIRISLAAMGDIHQIKGRSHNYPDSEPGAIIREICKQGVRNPVILFDEMDKMAGGVGGGEMMATFLEILDPEQNSEFWDHYLDMPYDLSKVLFLASANKISESEGPLIDRMELITLPDYTRDDKKTICQQYIVPRVLYDTGLTEDRGYTITFSDEVWDRLIDPFRWDSGMRTLKRSIYSICNKIARKALESGEKNYTITGENIRDYIMV